MSVDTFGIEKEFLRALLDDVAEGSAQLPEFQRGWVWPERNIASLLASISQGYPVGTVMMLRTGGPVRFKQRPVEGAEPAPGVQPERLILDGQQRLTSLFQAWRTAPGDAADKPLLAALVDVAKRAATPTQAFDASRVEQVRKIVSPDQVKRFNEGPTPQGTPATPPPTAKPIAAKPG